MSCFKILLSVVFIGLILPANYVLAENPGCFVISKIEYTEKKITQLKEITLNPPGEFVKEDQFQGRVDELIALLEAQKRAAAQGRDLDRLQETVNEISVLLEEKKTGPAKMSMNDFHSSICFQCHTVNEFSPSDKTRQQWRRMIENEGHAIFKDIPWENTYQKQQILQFLLENAGTYRAEGIGLWN